MAFTLSNRMGMRGGRFGDDTGGGFRGSTAAFGASASGETRGGFGAGPNNNVTSSNLPGSPHSSTGFRRALERTAQHGNRVVSGIKSRDFSMGKNRKPNYFAQGGHRRGLHIGAGAPVTTPASETGSDAGV